MNITVENTLKNLRKNNIDSYFVETGEEVITIIEKIVEKGSSVAVGGSMTLKELGILEHLKSGKYEFYDRYKEGLTPEEIDEVFVKSLSVDAYFCSSNAITEAGELYNVDGNSNRIAAIAYGPKNVIIVAGVNKIVKNLDEAIARVKTVAAPKNAVRLNASTYCGVKGCCVDLKGGLGTGCDSPQRLCKNYLISTKQKCANRIHVILVNRELGY